MEIGWDSCILDATYMQTMESSCSMILSTEETERN